MNYTLFPAVEAASDRFVMTLVSIVMTVFATGVLVMDAPHKWVAWHRVRGPDSRYVLCNVFGGMWLQMFIMDWVFWDRSLLMPVLSGFFQCIAIPAWCAIRGLVLLRVISRGYAATVAGLAIVWFIVALCKGETAANALYGLGLTPDINLLVPLAILGMAYMTRRRDEAADEDAEDPDASEELGLTDVAVEDEAVVPQVYFTQPGVAEGDGTVPIYTAHVLDDATNQ